MHNYTAESLVLARLVSDSAKSTLSAGKALAGGLPLAARAAEQLPFAWIATSQSLCLKPLSCC